MQTPDEVYFACKKTVELLREEQTSKLKELFIEETRKMLNRKYAKSQRDKTRKKKYGPRLKKPKLDS